MRLPKLNIINFLISVTFVLFFNEFLIYYIVIRQCSWPVLKPNAPHESLNAMVLADTHLLGSRKGHWWDKLRREWQMHRSFQTALTIHKPEIIFILGDIFDEGLWASDGEFDRYVKRFHSLFAVPEDVPLIVAVGNHDIGFHYGISDRLESRFSNNMNSSVVSLKTVKNNHFILINSMAMEGDGCSLCMKAKEQIINISKILNCNKDNNCAHEPRLHYSRPILLQHFPLYRKSDAECQESMVASLPNNPGIFRQRWECLSQVSTKFLITRFNPRLALGGHTHHSCLQVRETFQEYSVPSFSWRNRNDPSFFMIAFTPADHEINRCDIPKESTVIILYSFYCILVIFCIIYKLVSRRKCLIYSSVKNK